MDLSEIVKANVDPLSLAVRLNYSEGKGVTISKVLPWDAAKNIYYVNIDMAGENIYPGGQSAHRREVQFRVSAPEGTSYWDATNDFSFNGIKAGSVVELTQYIPVYDHGVKVFGTEPEGGTGPVEVMYGDVNDDKSIDSLDLAVLKKYLLDNSVSINAKAADTYKDSSIDSLDFATLKKYLLGTISELPVLS